MAGPVGPLELFWGIFNGKTVSMTVPLNLVICWMFFIFFVTKSVKYIPFYI